MRFAGDLSIEYDTDYTDMMIPPMTLQILAENAVKHGIEKKTNGFGKIVIRTRRTTSSDLIMVEDNGVGFDVEEYNDGLGSHVGLGNAKERLRHLLGATLIIESEIGKGTTVTIIIPRNKKKEDKESDQTEE
jgi:sensor histidine kinase YesM